MHVDNGWLINKPNLLSILWRPHSGCMIPTCSAKAAWRPPQASDCCECPTSLRLEKVQIFSCSLHEALQGHCKANLRPLWVGWFFTWIFAMCMSNMWHISGGSVVFMWPSYSLHVAVMQMKKNLLSNLAHHPHDYILRSVQPLCMGAQRPCNNHTSSHTYVWEYVKIW